MTDEKMKSLLQQCPRPWRVDRHCNHHPEQLKEKCPQVWIIDANNRVVTATTWNVDAVLVAEAFVAVVNAL